MVSTSLFKWCKHWWLNFTNILIGHLFLLLIKCPSREALTVIREVAGKAYWRNVSQRNLEQKHLIYNPANIFLFKLKNRNTRKRCMFKVSNKNTRTMSLTFFRCFYYQLWAYFTPFCSGKIAGKATVKMQIYSII